MFTCVHVYKCICVYICIYVHNIWALLLTRYVAKPVKKTNNTQESVDQAMVLSD